MSFLSDLFEGNFGNLGTDVSHAPESFVTDLPSEEPYLIGAGALAAGGLGLGLLGAGAGLDAGLAGAGALDSAAPSAAAGLDAATGTFGAFDPAVFGAESADVAAGVGTAETAAGTLGLDATAALDAGAGATDALAGGGTDALAGGVDASAGSPAALGFATDPSALDFAAAPDPFSGGASVSDPFAVGTDNAASTGGMDAGPATVDTGTSSGGLSSQLSQDMGSATADQAAVNQGAAAEGGAGAKAGSSSFLNDVFGGGSFGAKDAAMLGLAGAPLALTLLKGQPSLDTAGQAAQSNANALAAYGNQQLAAGTSGQLNAGQQAVINQMRQNLTNQYLQTLYNSGVTDPTKDSRWPAMQAQVEMQVAAQTQTMLQQEITNGLSALGSSGTVLTNISQQQMASDQAFTNNLVNATSSAARILAGGSQTVTVKAA